MKSPATKYTEADHADVAMAKPLHDDIDLPMWKLILVALPWISVQSIWATEFGLTTPYMKMLGMSKSWSSMVWIFGPITGFITGPIVGAMSDNCTSKYGRRRPFIVVGVILLWAASMVFANANHLGGGNTPTAQFIALFAFIVLDVVINIIQTPIRAIVSDVSSSRQQTKGQLLSVAFQSIGNLLGAAIMKFFGAVPEKIMPILLVVLSILTILVAIQVYFCEEKVHVPDSNKVRGNKFVEPFTVVFRSFRFMSRELMMISLVQFFSWYALFAYWPAASSWVGYNVYGGEDHSDKAIEEKNLTNPGEAKNMTLLKKKYDNGLEKNSIAGIYHGLFSLVFVFALMYSLKCLRLRIAYGVCLILGGLNLIFAKFGVNVGDYAYGVLVIVAMGVPLSAINAFPFALVGALNKNGEGEANETGVQMGILNVFICTPQLICTIVIAWMRSEMGDEGLPWGFFMAGVSFCIGGVLAFFLDDSKVDQRNLLRESLSAARASLNRA